MKKLYWQLLTRLRVLKNWQIPAWLEYGKIQFCSQFNALRVKEAPERKLLLFTWEFPPQVTGGVYRPVSWAKYAADADWAVSVLCSDASSLPTPAGIYLEHSIPREVQIQRIADRSEGPHPWPLPCVDGGLRNALSVYEAAQPLMQTDRPGVLVASGPPFHNFVAAAWLAEIYGWPLVLDYRDEWTASPFTFVLKDQANLRLEKRCLRRADLVVFTTDSQRVHALQNFQELDQAKCVLVPNGWEPSDFVMRQTTHQSFLGTSRSTITVAYLGNFGPMADPQPFLTTLSAILDVSPQLREQIKFICIGRKSPEAMTQLTGFKYQGILELVEQIPKQEACRVMQSVDLLLILNPPAVQRYIQGKLYEYIASGTPVLVFGKGGEMAEIVTSLDAGIIVDTKDEIELAQFLTNAKFQTQPIKSDKIDQWLKSRERGQLALNMFGHLDKLIRSPSIK